MFSTTTTAASTSMPVAMASPARLIRLAAMPSEHQSLDRLVLAALRDDAVARHGPDFHVGQVADADGRAVLVLHHDGAKVVETGDAALGAHQQDLVAFPEAARAVIAVVGLDGV